MLRRELVLTIQAGQPCAVINFEKVESVSDSFLDELLGVVVRDLGKQWFRDHIRLINIRPDDRKSLLSVIAQRLSDQPMLDSSREATA